MRELQKMLILHNSENPFKNESKSNNAAELKMEHDRDLMKSTAVGKESVHSCELSTCWEKFCFCETSLGGLGEGYGNCAESLKHFRETPHHEKLGGL